MQTARYQIADDIAARVIDGDVAIVNLSTGMYFNLEGASALVWAFLERRHTLDEVSRELGRRCHVDPAATIDDVERLVNELSQDGLVVGLADANSAPLPLDVEVSVPAHYSGLGVDRYSDMSELL